MKHLRHLLSITGNKNLMSLESESLVFNEEQFMGMLFYQTFKMSAECLSNDKPRTLEYHK